MNRSAERIVILDDDPTGIQTIRDIPVYTRACQTDLFEAYNHHPAFFLLTNSRALPEEKAVILNREIAQNLLDCQAKTQIPFLVVSRGDSTLRGHFPAETDALRSVLQAHTDIPTPVILCPFFLEGGRKTINGMHYVCEGGKRIPVGKTEFAQDPVFGYHSSDLRDYVVEKANGSLSKKDIELLSLERLRNGEATAAILSGKRVIVCDGEYDSDMNLLAQGIHKAIAGGVCPVVRCAASLVRALLNQKKQPPLNGQQLIDPTGSGVLIIAGSHVKKTSRQLEYLKSKMNLKEFILDVTENLSDQIDPICLQTNSALAQKKLVLISTSRTPVHFPSITDHLAFSARISDALCQIVQKVTVHPAAIIAKGGITSYDIGTKALKISRAVASGQAAEGIPVWKAPTGRFPGLPFLIFPGNVGSDDTLYEVVKKIRGLSQNELPNQTIDYKWYSVET